MPKRRDYTSINIRIGRNLRRIRFEHALSQAQLGEIMGVSVAQVSHYELGEHSLYLDRAAALADHFGFDLAELLAPVGPALDRRHALRSVKRPRPDFGHMPLRVEP